MATNTPNYDNKEVFAKFGTSDYRAITIDSSQIKRPNGETLEETLVDFETRISALETSIGMPYDATETMISRLEKLEAVSIPELAVTRDSVIKALGYTPAREGLWSSFDGATDSDTGTMGFVPQPVIGQKDCFLRGDGVWAPIPTEGLLSAETAALTYIPQTQLTTLATTSALNNYYTKSEAEAKFLGINAKARTAATADLALSIPGSDTGIGNIWIRER